LKGDDPALKELLQELQGIVSQTKKTSIAEVSPSYIRDNINLLIRHVGNYYQTNQTKETAYVFYWLIIPLLWNIEHLIKMNNDVLLEKHSNLLERKTTELASEFKQKYENLLFQQHEFYESQIADLQEKLKAEKVKYEELQQEMLFKEKEYYAKMSEISTNPIMEGLERTYGKVREAINESYNSQFQYLFQIL